MEFNLLHSNRRAPAVAAEISRADPDVLVLLEYDPHWHRALGPQLTAAYPHAARQVVPGSFGWAVYSRLPIVSPARDLAPPEVSNRNLVRVVLSLDGRHLALYAVHLNPPKGLAAFVSQTRGLVQLASLLPDEELPVLLAGDFNFTCRHRMHRILAEQGLDDAHDSAGWGRGSTWPANGILACLPGVRIDHLYTDSRLTCTSIQVGHRCGSDHRPLLAELGFASDPDTRP
jgi:endonuclease/exonuclease/phosphatase (EEP) superfamily protein YafD